MTGYKWTEFYKAALLETDWTKMRERLQTAEAALLQRKREFALKGGGRPDENHAIDDALHSLNILRNEAGTWLNDRERKNVAISSGDCTASGCWGS